MSVLRCILGPSIHGPLAGVACALMAVASMNVAAEPIRIGCSMSQTGPLAAAGKSALLAFDIWREETNAKGGLLGRPVEIVCYDDQSNPSLVPGIYSKLLDVDKVDLVVSAYGTNQIAPAMPVVMRHGMLFMALFGTGVNEDFRYDKYFQILPNGKEGKVGYSRGFLDIAMSMDPKPQTIALAGADAEFAQNVLKGMRENVAHLGLKTVYDRSYPPNTVDFAALVRSIQATNPDVVFIASYPPDSVGIVRAANEVGLSPRMFGGGMIGLAYASIKLQLGPLLNGIVANDVYAPEPTMKFPGIDDFLVHYRERAAKAGVDPLGQFLPPYAYAEMQVLAQAVAATQSLDQGKLAAYVHATGFSTIVGDVKFSDSGEWEKGRLLYIQYQGIKGSDIEQFKLPGRQVILSPAELKSGKFIYPYADAKR
jgi:branched-chain amino acid transport system substrate-binding protein